MKTITQHSYTHMIVHKGILVAQFHADDEKMARKMAKAYARIAKPRYKKEFKLYPYPKRTKGKR